MWGVHIKILNIFGITIYLLKIQNYFFKNHETIFIKF
jgi:hypothetical protein